MSLAQSLLQLKSLIVHACDSLEHLVVIKEHDIDKGEEILSNPLFFSKLESLSIDSCERLEYIFPIFIARGLVQLEALVLSNALQLKHVFYLDHQRGENVVARDGKEIVLPNLKRLTLEELANFISLCPENYHFNCPALEEITTKKCSNLATSFMVEIVAKD
ncbi:hypothetical protein Pint_27468 [Pistacia integerrima]|uniref:Uncharacterized protein n=1 Tax=Pistacia integerrima TaxID=434235 RepID=A0ACC0YT95_9ROSI|nr:hypothetical protein Pint_27468 [Pistacia integerrima]